jgi:hypothetical protein
MKKILSVALTLMMTLLSCKEPISLFPLPFLGAENLDNPSDLDGEFFLYSLEDTADDIRLSRPSVTVNNDEKIFFSAHIPRLSTYRIRYMVAGTLDDQIPNPFSPVLEFTSNTNAGRNPDNWFTINELRAKTSPPPLTAGESYKLFYEVQIIVDPVGPIFGGVTDIGEVYFQG